MNNVNYKKRMDKLTLFGFFKRESHRDSEGEVVTKIQSGDINLREDFISRYKTFIVKTVARVTGKYVDIEASEEYSIGLIAFNEAINKYDASKNSSFLHFADLLINRRLIDYIRSNKKNRNILPFTYFEDDIHSFEEQYLKENDNLAYNIEIKEEILIFKERLADFGISFNDLAKYIPKHIDSKRLCMKIANTIVGNREIYEKMMRTGNIPITDLIKLLDVHRVTIDRNRKFIITLCLIMKSELEVIKGYINFFER
ncbi:MAG: RNA polymerase sigma-I factor [Clostridia bacterium]|nr:RNA polymerase sigma-I factor [Clostridia bacterium]